MTIEFEGDRKAFLQLLQDNKGLMIFKFTADWCKPCQTIKSGVDLFFSSISSDIVKCYEVNVDECFDLFAFMKTKKMMKGIPTMMAYKKGTTSFSPDDSISGADLNEINAFFMRCMKLI
mgnify:FL=1|jgi:thiol-disulfide isomerase/thioredoxin